MSGLSFDSGPSGVTTGNVWYPTQSGLAAPGGFLDRLQAAMDNRAQYQGTLTGLAPALQASGVPVQPPQGLLSGLIGKVLGGGAQPQPQAPMPTATSAPGTGLGNGASAPAFSSTGGGGGAAPTSGPAAGGFMPVFADAISSIESKGNYGAAGPVTKSGDQALGKYQVMASNVGPWTKELLGQELTPQQFLASPQAQDAVFQGKFGQYLQQTGTPQDAASMWFTGRPYAQGAGAQDQLGTTGAGYVSKFMAALPGGGGSSGSAAPSQATAYAPGSGAMPRAPAVDALNGAAPMPIARNDGSGQSAQPGSQPADGSAGGATASPGQVVGALMSNPQTRGIGGALWQRAQQAGAMSGQLTLPAGMTPDALAQMISTPQTQAMGLGIWEKSLFPQVQAFKPGDYLMRGNQPMGQVPSPLQHVVIGKNAFGEDIYGTFDQNAGRIVPDPQTGQGLPPSAQGQGAGAGTPPALGGVPAPGAPGSPPAGTGATNPAVLANMPPPIAAQVQAIAEGRMKMPPVSSRSPLAARMPSLVLAYKPDFDQTTADARFDTRKNFADGPAAQGINSGNTAVQHAADLSDAAEALGNGNYPLVNKLRQAYGDATGGNIPGKEFAGALNDFTSEVVRFYRNSGGTEADIASAKANLDPSQSPDQLRAGIQQQARLIAGKTSAFQNQWHLGMGPNEPDFPIFSKETQAALARINARPPSTSSYPPSDAGGAAPASTSLPVASPVGASQQAGSIPTLTDPAQLQALPPGARFRTPDGQLRVRH